MPRYTINEPHPTVAKDAFIHAGRGGAGNHFRAPVTTPASGVASEVKVMPPTSARFYSGRGGAGNVHAKAERPVLSFDEEYTRQAAREQQLRGYVGRGGAGNAYSKATTTSEPVRKGSDASSHRSSTSDSSVRSGFFARLSLGSKH